MNINKILPHPEYLKNGSKLKFKCGADVAVVEVEIPKSSSTQEQIGFMSSLDIKQVTPIEKVD